MQEKSTRKWRYADEEHLMPGVSGRMALCQEAITEPRANSPLDCSARAYALGERPSAPIRPTARLTDAPHFAPCDSNRQKSALLLLPRNKASSTERHVHDVARRHHGHHDEEQHAIAECGRNPANQEGAQPNSHVKQHEIGGIRGGETIVGTATHGKHETIGLHRANTHASKRPPTQGAWRRFAQSP